MYNCEVWSILCYKKLCDANLVDVCDKAIFEQLNLNMCKYLLGIRKNASNLAARGELGRYPLLLDFLRHSFNFRDRISQLPYSRVYDAFVESKNLGPSSWANQLDALPTKLSCFDSNISTKTNTFSPAKLHQLYAKSWLDAINKPVKNKLCSLAQVKDKFELEKYMLEIPFIRRRDISKLRTSAHALEVEVGRYRKKLDPASNKLVPIERHERLCTTCSNGEVEDERHFITSCNLFSEERKSFILQLEHKLGYKPDSNLLFKIIFGLNSVENNNFTSLACSMMKAFSSKRFEYKSSSLDLSRCTFTNTTTRAGRKVQPPQRLIDVL